MFIEPIIPADFYTANRSIKTYDFQPHSCTVMREFAKRLFNICYDQVDLKYIFDHFRNYLICGALFYAGTVLLNRGAMIGKIPYFGFVAGWLFQVLAFVLFSLNFTHGQFAVRAITDKPFNHWVFAAFSVFLFFALVELVVVR